jgi:rhodanese-related sulfurtransferase
VVHCVKGKWVSQKAAAYLGEHGFDVRSLNGGIDARDAQ